MEQNEVIDNEEMITCIYNKKKNRIKKVIFDEDSD